VNESNVLRQIRNRDAVPLTKYSPSRHPAK
jgi:hypothetical protein